MVIMGIVLYFILPNILNYPPGSINNQFDREYAGITYNQQFGFLVPIIILLLYLFLRIVYRKIYCWKEVERIIESGDLEKIKEIRRVTLNVPHFVYFFQGFFPLLIIILMHSIFAFFTESDIKLLFILFTYLFLGAVISYTLSRGYFRDLLRNIQLDNYEDKRVLKINLKEKAFLQIVPLFVIAILFTALVGYTQITKERGNLIFYNYIRQLDKIGNREALYNESQIMGLLNKIELEQQNDVKFFIAPDGRIKTFPPSKLGKFFIRYTQQIAFQYQGHTYAEYGSDNQGAVKRLKGVNGHWIIGVKYNTASPEIFISFIITLMALLSAAVFVLYFYAKTLSDDIKIIADNLSEIAEKEDRSLEEKIPVISNDETGELEAAFNKIQERVKKHIETIKKDQVMLMERERLVSLGQMIGGIAHNFRSPIMSIAGYIEDLKDLVNEFKESLDNPCVLKEDYIDIADDMFKDLNDMKPYCSYMSDLLSAVRGQAVQLNASTHYNFSVEEVVTRIELLVNFELKKYNCKMNLALHVDPQTRIIGEISNLVQVLNNIIYNAIQSYPENTGGMIDFTIEFRNGDLLFLIRDYGKGIPADVQNKLFAQMITTKGTKGTGLGLYMSYLTIKGRFQGDLYFESRENEGTTFYVSIPCQREEVKPNEV
jgi:signal transduction histidine kinase